VVNPTGPLVGADETFAHQIADTFAVVGSGDLAWTERVCAMAAARDGSLQLGFGLGKYPNRNVLDAYAGVSRGVSQVTVRASRRLSPRPEDTAVGPIRYEVVEPLHAVRFVLEPNDCQPVSFDCTFEGAVPAFLEDRVHVRTGYRVASDLVRYHQVGVARGWIDVDGARTEITPDAWVSTRDHSWGVRHPPVGVPPDDLEPSRALSGVTFRMIWCPLLMERPDGSRYGLHLHYQIFEAPGFVQRKIEGGIEHPDGRRQRWRDLEPDLRFDPTNRRLIGGTIAATTEDGVTHRLEIESVSETGFHLGAGLYFGFDGHHHGEWRGELHVDGERIDNCSSPEAARRLHQLRDTVVHVVDPVDGAEGWGNCQPMLTGPDPATGLTEADSFI
jgi:hypothetical protein